MSKWDEQLQRPIKRPPENPFAQMDTPFNLALLRLSERVGERQQWLQQQLLAEIQTHQEEFTQLNKLIQKKDAQAIYDFFFEIGIPKILDLLVPIGQTFGLVKKGWENWTEFTADPANFTVEHIEKALDSWQFKMYKARITHILNNIDKKIPDGRAEGLGIINRSLVTLALALALLAIFGNNPAEASEKDDKPHRGPGKPGLLLPIPGEDGRSWSPITDVDPMFNGTEMEGAAPADPKGVENWTPPIREEVTTTEKFIDVLLAYNAGEYNSSGVEIHIAAGTYEFTEVLPLVSGSRRIIIEADGPATFDFEQVGTATLPAFLYFNGQDVSIQGPLTLKGTKDSSSGLELAAIQSMFGSLNLGKEVKITRCNALNVIIIEGGVEGEGPAENVIACTISDSRFTHALIFSSMGPEGKTILTPDHLIDNCEQITGELSYKAGVWALDGDTVIQGSQVTETTVLERLFSMAPGPGTATIEALQITDFEEKNPGKPIAEIIANTGGATSTVEMWYQALTPQQMELYGITPEEIRVTPIAHIEAITLTKTVEDNVLIEFADTEGNPSAINGPVAVKTIYPDGEVEYMVFPYRTGGYASIEKLIDPDHITDDGIVRFEVSQLGTDPYGEKVEVDKTSEEMKLNSEQSPHIQNLSIDITSNDLAKNSGETLSVSVTPTVTEDFTGTQIITFSLTANGKDPIPVTATNHSIEGERKDYTLTLPEDVFGTFQVKATTTSTEDLVVTDTSEEQFIIHREVPEDVLPQKAELSGIDEPTQEVAVQFVIPREIFGTDTSDDDILEVIDNSPIFFRIDGPGGEQNISPMAVEIKDNGDIALYAIYNVNGGSSINEEDDTQKAKEPSKGGETDPQEFVPLNVELPYTIIIEVLGIPFLPPEDTRRTVVTIEEDPIEYNYQIFAACVLRNFQPENPSQ